MDNFNPNSSVYTPGEAATIAIRAVEQAQKLELRSIPLPLLDGYFDPVAPGELCIIQAQTSNGKSMFIQYWEDQIAIDLMASERTNEAIIHISVEDLVETQVYYELGRETGDSPGDLARGKVIDWEKLMQAAVRVGTIPIYRISASLARADEIPMLHLGNIMKAIDYLIGGEIGMKVIPAVIFIDYLQALPFDPEVSKTELDGRRRLQVRQDIYRSRLAAAKYAAPIVLAAQSRQNLQGANPPMMIPGMYDIEETASAAQRADRIISLWMPKVNYPVGKRIPLDNGKILQVDENLLYVKVCKQRGGRPSGKIFPCRADFKTYNIAKSAE